MTNQGQIERREPSRLAKLPTGYFALVMATGIIAVAAFQHGLESLSIVLIVANVVFAVVLAVLYLARLVRYRDMMLDDLTSEARAPGYLTIVAATNVLGGGFIITKGWIGAATVFWVVGLVFCVLLTYGVLLALTFAHDKAPLDRGLNGTWLLLIVGTQSIAVLGATIAPHLNKPDPVLFISVMSFGIGFLLYIIVITLVCYRWWFFPMTSDEETPTYWVNMGALGITALAGSNLIAAADRWSFIQSLEGFLTGAVVVSWSFASFWIPLLIGMGLWSHVVQRVPLRYSAEFWSMVFPLGMYSAATYQMNKVLGIDLLGWLSGTFLVIALIVWAVTFVGLLRSLPRTRGAPRMPISNDPDAHPPSKERSHGSN